MKSMKTSSFCITILALSLLILVPAETSEAKKWGIGVSYETRDADPGRGFGVRLERSILSSLPLVNVDLRAHFSYFSEDVDSYRDIQAPAELDVYDFGLSAIGGINLGLLSPYVGAGLGSESFSAVQTGVQDRNVDENSFYWNFYGGVAFPLLRVIKPFAEYRFTRLMGSDEFDYSHNSRIAIGVTFNF